MAVRWTASNCAATVAGVQGSSINSVSAASIVAPHLTAVIAAAAAQISD